MSRTRRALGQYASRVSRLAKYGLAAPLLKYVVRYTSILDGGDAPPVFINFSGGGDFAQIGAHQVSLISSRLGLKGHESVLDIGCGIGRVALPFAQRFPELRYLGFDVVGYGIEWARKKTRLGTSYMFLHADIKNSFYNPFGSIDPRLYRFPSDDSSIDVVFATSVFTHLLKPVAQHYLRESARVLNPSGSLYITTFLTGFEPEPSPAFEFSERFKDTSVASSVEPEMAVGFSLNEWAEMASEAGLTVNEVYPGSWRGGAKREDFQDAIILTVRSLDGNRGFNEHSSVPSPCELFSKLYEGTEGPQQMTFEEWHDLRQRLHDEARASGRLCPCGK